MWLNGDADESIAHGWQSLLRRWPVVSSLRTDPTVIHLGYEILTEANQTKVAKLSS
jgi:hypothetical protein